MFKLPLNTTFEPVSLLQENGGLEIKEYKELFKDVIKLLPPVEQKLVLMSFDVLIEFEKELISSEYAENE